MRFVVTIGIFVTFLSTGMQWLVGFTSFDLLGVVGSAVGTCQCPPTNDTSTGKLMLGLLPYLLPPGLLFPSLFLIPATVIVALASFFRLRLVPVAGIMAVVTGASWVALVWLIGPKLSVVSSYGPDAIMLGGLILIIAYVLDRFEKLDPSEDFD